MSTNPLWLITLLLISLAGTGSLSGQDETDDQRATTEKELQALRQRIKQLQTSQAKNRDRLSAEQQSLKEADIAINKSTQALTATRRALNKSQSRLADLNRQQTLLTHNKTTQQQALAAQIRAAYMNGNQEYIKLLLNQEDPAKLARALVYYDYLNQARAEKIANLKTTLVDLGKVIEQIDQEQQRLSELEKEQAHQTTKLTSLKKQRQTVVAKLQRQVTTDQKKLEEWQANEIDLVSILDTLEKQIATILPEQALTGLSELKGQLIWPVNGKLKERFGRRREGSQARWSGVMIGAASGMAVQSIYHGRVVYSDYLRGFGLITIIDHGDGYMSLYGHNEALYKSAGDWVEAGERIAIVGQTGGYPSTGLYFEIRHKSRAINPLSFIRRG